MRSNNSHPTIEEMQALWETMLYPKLLDYDAQLKIERRVKIWSRAKFSVLIMIVGLAYVSVKIGWDDLGPNAILMFLLAVGYFLSLIHI